MVIQGLWPCTKTGKWMCSIKLKQHCLRYKSIISCFKGKVNGNYWSWLQSGGPLFLVTVWVRENLVSMPGCNSYYKILCSLSNFLDHLPNRTERCRWLTTGKVHLHLVNTEFQNHTYSWCLSPKKMKFSVMYLLQVSDCYSPIYPG